jgi:hypothetical protein
MTKLELKQDELIEILTELIPEWDVNTGIWHKYKLLKSEIASLKEQEKRKPDYRNDIYGPGDDNYGRDKPFWKQEKEQPKLSGDKLREYLEDCNVKRPNFLSRTQIDMLVYILPKWYKSHIEQKPEKELSLRDELMKYEIFHGNNEEDASVWIDEYLASNTVTTHDLNEIDRAEEEK